MDGVGEARRALERGRRPRGRRGWPPPGRSGRAPARPRAGRRSRGRPRRSRGCRSRRRRGSRSRCPGSVRRCSGVGIELRWTETKRSARIAVAMAARFASGTEMSPVRVRTPSRPPSSSAPGDAPRDGERDVLLPLARRRERALLLAAVAGVEHHDERRLARGERERRARRRASGRSTRRRIVAERAGAAARSRLHDLERAARPRPHRRSTTARDAGRAQRRDDRAGGPRRIDRREEAAVRLRVGEDDGQRRRRARPRRARFGVTQRQVRLRAARARRPARRGRARPRAPAPPPRGGAAPTPEPSAISQAWPSRPNPVTSVSAWTAPLAASTSPAARFSAAITSIDAVDELPAARCSRLMAVVTIPDPSGFVSRSTSPGPRADVAEHAVGVDEAGDRHAVLRLGVVDAVAAEDRARRRAAPSPRRRGAPRRASPSGSLPTGQPTRLSAKSGRPPIAQTSEKAFAAAMRPNQYGSSTTGVKKSTVSTIACVGVEAVHGGVVARLVADERARILAPSEGGAGPAPDPPGGSCRLNPRRGESAVSRTVFSGSVMRSPYRRAGRRQRRRALTPTPASCRYISALRLPGEISRTVFQCFTASSLRPGREEREAEVEARRDEARALAHDLLVLRGWPARARPRRAARRRASRGCRRRRGRARARGGTPRIASWYSPEESHTSPMSAYMLASFPWTKRSSLPAARAGAGERVAVGLLRLLVLAGVVVGDGEVQRGVGVPGVDAERRLEGAQRFLVLPLVVVDDAEHVVDVGERLVLLDDLRQVLLGEAVLLLEVVAAAERERLLQGLVHPASLAPAAPRHRRDERATFRPRRGAARGPPAAARGAPPATSSRSSPAWRASRSTRICHATHPRAGPGAAPPRAPPRRRASAGSAAPDRAPAPPGAALERERLAADVGERRRLVAEARAPAASATATTRARAPSTATVISARRSVVERDPGRAGVEGAGRARAPRAASRTCVSGLFSAAESGPRSAAGREPRRAGGEGERRRTASRTRRARRRGGRPSAEPGKELLRLAAPRVLRVLHDELLERGAGAVLLVDARSRACASFRSASASCVEPGYLSTSVS